MSKQELKLLYELPPHGWHYEDEDGMIHFIGSKEEFEKLKKERENKKCDT